MNNKKARLRIVGSEQIIKACPHCGGTASLCANYSYKTRGYFVFVKCDICGAQGKIYKSSEDPRTVDWDSIDCDDAVAAWNLRTPDTEA